MEMDLHQKKSPTSLLIPKKLSMHTPIITHISTVHSAFDIRIFHKECRSLAASGMRVNLIVTHDKEEMIDNVLIVPLPKFKNRFTRIFIKPFLAFSKALRTKADLFHFHDPELIPIGLLLKVCGKKVIYDVHEDVSSQILDKYWIHKRLRAPISILFKTLESFAARFFDGMVTSTPYIKDLFIKRNSININNYPLNEEIMDYPPIIIKKKTKEKIITYVGGISKERGIFEILKAIEGTDIKLHLAGEASPKNLIKTLEMCPGWQNVVYFGQVKRDKICSILSNSQVGICLLHPTLTYVNSLPIKLFEYMGAGLPVIASRFPFWEYLLKDIDNAVFVDPLNPEEIRKSINSLMEDEEKRMSMGKRGLRAVQENYNWNREKEKLIHFYSQLGIGKIP
jgi:glycosyltransferase involved in cell wall biosynthesis